MSRNDRGETMIRLLAGLAIAAAGVAGSAAGAGASGGPEPAISSGSDGIVAPRGYVRKRVSLLGVWSFDAISPRC
jgi:hypothetical protein